MNIEPNETKLPKLQSQKTASERAAERADEILSNFDGRTMDEGTDDFFIEKDKIPEDWSYEWKRFTVFNQEDPSYQVQLRRDGWEPVPASRHPEMMPVGSKDPTIVRKGMMLMERPTVITEHKRQIANKEARDQVRVKEQQLNEAPQGQFERDNKGAKLANIKKSYEAIPIPDKT